MIPGDGTPAPPLAPVPAALQAPVTEEAPVRPGDALPRAAPLPTSPRPTRRAARDVVPRVPPLQEPSVPGLPRETAVDPQLLGPAVGALRYDLDQVVARVAVLQAGRGRAGQRKLVLVALSLGYLLALAGLALAGLAPAVVEGLAQAGMVAALGGVAGNVGEHAAAAWRGRGPA